MIPRSRTRSMTETAIVAAIGAIATIMGYYVPFLNIFLIFTAIPFAIITLRSGISYGVAGAFIASIIVAMATNPISALITLISSGVNGIFLGVVVQKKLKAWPAIVVTTLATLFSLYLSYYVVLPITGVDLNLQMDMMIEEMKVTMEAMQDSMNADAQATAESTQMLENYTRNMKLLIPSAIVMSALASAAANYMLFRVILKRMGVALPDMKPFREFRLPGSVFFGMLIMIVLSYLAGYFGLIQSEALLANIYMVFSMAFVLQGVAVIVYFFKHIPGQKLLKWLLVVMLAFTGGTIYLALLGMSDVMLNFRKRYESRSMMR
ncbi:YybS family protein [Acidaminobacter hydrogenoformans]|uniref:Uncharacterized conserved protein YybS, DUF2232 family n=1 Tax=Acidaminobacter hydrogenoformans DSM 2784 TaxID=1120920 RepID=A0A1G5RRE5_9FIRM|nr:DUF2232 domain-containing protein [Acidaminobacter hydrogenoformans]SCZ76614.1 Uncharacterized conserved protein YybS, DUF2232 family [Acidaminobacter hydrogenoformans DSM 2784]